MRELIRIRACHFHVKDLIYINVEFLLEILVKSRILEVSVKPQRDKAAMRQWRKADEDSALIKVFTVRMGKAYVLNHKMGAHTLISLVFWMEVKTGLRHRWVLIRLCLFLRDAALMEMSRQLDTLNSQHRSIFDPT